MQIKHKAQERGPYSANVIQSFGPYDSVIQTLNGADALDRAVYLANELDHERDPIEIGTPAQFPTRGALIRLLENRPDILVPALLHVREDRLNFVDPWGALSARRKRVLGEDWFQVFVRDALIGEIRNISNSHGSMFWTPAAGKTLLDLGAVVLTIHGALAIARGPTFDHVDIRGAFSC